jgi:hypothetical protein
MTLHYLLLPRLQTCRRTTIVSEHALVVGRFREPPLARRKLQRDDGRRDPASLRDRFLASHRSVLIPEDPSNVSDVLGTKRDAATRTLQSVQAWVVHGFPHPDEQDAGAKGVPPAVHRAASMNAKTPYGEPRLNVCREGASMSDERTNILLVFSCCRKSRKTNHIPWYYELWRSMCKWVKRATR